MKDNRKMVDGMCIGSDTHHNLHRTHYKHTMKS